MSTPYDVAFGRLAIERGLLTREQVQQVHGQLAPGQGLSDALVRSGLLRPEQAQRLQLELSPGGDSTATLPAPSGPRQSSSSSSTGGLPDIGERIGGRYEVLATLGRGGMGVVLRARDLQLDLEVAVKVLLPGADAGGTAVERFEREAQAMSKVDRHAGIVRIRDAGMHGASPYAVLDLVLGGDLRSRVKAEGPLPVAEAAQQTERVARAIAHCHAQGILHRDLKPANVLVRGEDGQPFLTDFGLVRDAEAERLTKTGQVLGTPSYMSPEQADGDWHAIDERTDVYGLGAILYELLVGEPPFRGEGLQVLKQVLLDPPVPPAERRAEVPADLSAICCKALAKDQSLRYATAGALADDLAAFLRGDPLTVRAPGRREHFGWALRRRQPWALTVLLGMILIPIALTVGAVVVVLQVQSVQRAEQLRAHVAGIAGSLDDDDPLLLETAEEAGAQLRLALTLCAQVRGDAERPGAERLTEDDLTQLTVWLETPGPIRQALGEDGVTSLQRLMRRYAVSAGWPAPWEALGPPGEDHLFVALKHLGWRRQAVVTAYHTGQAEQALRQATQPEGVAKGAAVVRKRLSAARQALDAYLSEGSHPRVLWSPRTWTRRANSLDALLEQHSDLRSAVRGDLGLRATVAAMHRQIAAVKRTKLGDDRWKNELVYLRVWEWYRRRVLELVGEEADLASVTTEFLAVLAVRAKRATITVSGLRAIVDLALALADNLEWTKPEFIRPMVDLAIVHLEDAIPNRRALDPKLLELLPRLGYLTAQGNIRPVVRKTLPALIKHAQAVNRGDAWLNVAAASEEVGGNRPADLRRYMALYGRALGERLTRTERLRLLEREALTPLSKPLTPMWEPYARYRIAVQVVELAGKATPPNLAWLKVGADEVQRLWRAGGKMPRDSLRLAFLRHGAQALQSAVERNTAWKEAYAGDAQAMIEAGEQLAWTFMEQAINGGGERKETGSLFDADHAIDPDKNEYDWVNQMKRLLSFYWVGSFDEGLRRYEAAQAKLRHLRGHTNLGLELHALMRCVHFGGAAGLARAQGRLEAIQAEAARRWERAPNEQQRKKAAGLMEEAVVLEIRMALAEDRLERALTLYREVIDRRGGEHRWWSHFIVPLLCDRLVKAKRRKTIVALLERLVKAKARTKPSQDVFRVALGR